ncbi:hypothetical protein ACWD5Q_24890 [Streptomyces sp. NPDC002513]
MSAPRPAPGDRSAPDTATVVVRWAWFTCGLVPVVLVWSGTSVAGAISATLGLTAVTWACRALLRQSERGAARAVDADHAPCATRHRGAGSAPRPAGYGGAGSAVRPARYGGAGTGARGGGRNRGANTPVD